MDDNNVQSHDKCLLCDRFVNIVYIYILYMQIQLNLKACCFIVASQCCVVVVVVASVL